MSNKKPLLSIVVPTKDRYRYLEKLLELIDSFNYDSNEFEVVLQDNTQDNSRILKFLAEKKYPFVVYNHKAEQIPIYLNSDLAILVSSGEYVCFIGDDDGVTRDILDWVKWMKDSGNEVLIPLEVAYDWPDSYSVTGVDTRGILSFPPITAETVVRDSMEEMGKLIDIGFIDRKGLPLVYHGIVKRTALDKVYSQGGTFFPGPSPDIANGVALALVCDKYVYVGQPIVISGASSTHGGGAKKMKGRGADIASMPFLPQNCKENWEEKIPLVWTGPTVWCESAIKALRYMHREDLIDKVNFEHLYSFFTAYHYPYRNLAYKLTRNKLKLFVSSWLMIIKRYWNGAMRLVKLRLNLNNDRVLVRDVVDIIEAEEELTKRKSYVTL